MLVAVGLLVGLTTVLFGFGGGFVTVPIVTVVNAGQGTGAAGVAAATSAMVMLVNAAVATASTRHAVLRELRGRTRLFGLLALGGALGAAAARLAPEALIRWGFVAYVGLTVLDLLVRPGFLTVAPAPRSGRARAGLSTGLGLPVGALAAFLGVGGSVLTVPLMRRAGTTMPVATALANPLTLGIALPATVVALLVRGPAQLDGLVGAVDVSAAVALLVGSMPVIVLLRRRPPRIPDRVHAWGYVLLLVAAAATVAVAG